MSVITKQKADHLLPSILPPGTALLEDRFGREFRSRVPGGRGGRLAAFGTDGLPAEDRWSGRPGQTPAPQMVPGLDAEAQQVYGG